MLVLWLHIISELLRWSNFSPFKITLSWIAEHPESRLMQFPPLCEFSLKWRSDNWFFRPFVEYQGTVLQDEVQIKQKELEAEANNLISKGEKVCFFLLIFYIHLIFVGYVSHIQSFSGFCFNFSIWRSLSTLWWQYPQLHTQS